MSQIIQLILVFLGLATPVVKGPVPSQVLNQPKRVHAKVRVDPNSMLLRSDPILHRFIYLFKGTATLGGQPCPKASVLVRLLAGDNTVAKGTVTEDDGTYSLEVAIDAEDRSPVDWAMEAYTADFKKVELSGRQIVQREEEPGQEPDKKPIIVTNPVDFVISLSK